MHSIAPPMECDKVTEDSLINVQLVGKCVVHIEEDMFPRDGSIQSQLLTVLHCMVRRTRKGMRVCKRSLFLWSKVNLLTCLYFCQCTPEAKRLKIAG